MKNIIEKYKKQTLSDEELLREESLHIKKMLDIDREARWSQQLASQGVHRNQQPTQSKPLLVFLRPLMRVAALLFITTAAWFAYTNYSKPPANTQELAYNLLEEPFHLINNNTRSNSDNSVVEADALREKAYTSYQEGKFETAIQAMRTAILAGKPTASEHFLIALSYLQNTDKQADKALEHLLAAQQLGDAYKDEINLYLGVTYLLLNEHEKAESTLKAVVESPSSRHHLIEKATNLRQK